MDPTAVAQIQAIQVALLRVADELGLQPIESLRPYRDYISWNSIAHRLHALGIRVLQ